MLIIGPFVESGLLRVDERALIAYDQLGRWRKLALT